MAFDPGAYGYSGIGALLALAMCHDHVTSLCLSLPLVAFDPGAYGYSGIGALLALAMSHSAVMTTSLLYVCPCHWWPLTPEPTGIRASVHCEAFFVLFIDHLLVPGHRCSVRIHNPIQRS